MRCRPPRLPPATSSACCLAPHPAPYCSSQGLQNALAAGADEVAIFTAASEAFNRRNTNCGIDESLRRYAAAAATAAAIEVAAAAAAAAIAGMQQLQQQYQ